MRGMSLATRVSAFFLVALAITLAGFSASLFALARGYLYRELDGRLDAALATLEAAVDIETEGLEWEPTERRLVLGVEPGPEGVRWAIRDPAGLVIDRSANSAGGAFPIGWSPSSWPIEPPDASVFGGAPGWRLAARRLRLADLLALGRAHAEDDEPERDVEYPELTMVAGLAPDTVESSLQGLGGALIGLSSGLWLASALVGRWLCRRALAPLVRMAADARGMAAPASAAPLDLALPSPGTGDELEDLGLAFNDLLGRLREAFDRQARFTGDASHELRTPLAGLLSLVEVTRRRPRPPLEYEETLDRVHAETLRLRSIVESLLFLARADADPSAPELPRVEPIALATWLPSLLDRWIDHPRASDLRVEADTPLVVLAGPTLLAQAVGNLVDNALKYSPAGSPVLLRVEADPRRGFASIAVEDRGPGLDEAARAHAFEPFYRSPKARQGGRPGVGLGLSVVRRIASHFGGSADVESRPGLGSTFRIRLPEAPGARS